MVERQLCGCEYWSDGYYIGSISGKGDRSIIENYIKKQGKDPDIKQLSCLIFKTPCAPGAG